mmetsp:Transcript_16182/g.35503  ORF Transcript_16182/g.35503 Transcript_16182/m.35503 type:complete len:318 (+) Transcript_16182:62-1015(+)
MARSNSKASTASKSTVDGRFEDGSISLPQFGPGSTQTDQNLMERLGSDKVVVKLVGEVLRDMRSDPAMGRFFARVNANRLRDRISEYLIGEWGGTPYKGPDLWIAHSHMDITNEYYDLFISYFQSALKRAQMPKWEIQDVMDSLRQIRSLIVDESQRVRDAYMEYIDGGGKSGKKQATPRSSSASPRDGVKRAMKAAIVNRALAGPGAAAGGGGGSPRSPRTVSTRCSTPSSSEDSLLATRRSEGSPRGKGRSQSKSKECSGKAAAKTAAKEFCPDLAFNFSTEQDSPPGQPRNSALQDDFSLRLFPKPMLGPAHFM